MIFGKEKKELKEKNIELSGIIRSATYDFQVLMSKITSIENSISVLENKIVLMNNRIMSLSRNKHAEEESKEIKTEEVYI